MVASWIVWNKGMAPVRDAWFVEISIPNVGRWHANLGEDFTAFVNRHNRWESAEKHFAANVFNGANAFSSLFNPAEESVRFSRMVALHSSGSVTKIGGE